MGKATPYRGDKAAVVRALARRFAAGRDYTEAQVDAEIECAIAADPSIPARNPRFEVTHLRRALVEFGLLDRQKDGRRYWRTAEPAETAGMAG